METLGKYRLREKLAVGGMAEIWIATTHDSGVARVCVVKRILPHLAETAGFVRMFLDEARIVASLTHPNVVQLLDVGEADGQPFLAMEYLHGADLRAVKRALRGRSPQRMPLEHAVHVGIGAAAGLHYAHEKRGLDGRALNIVHRDVSPQNVLVTYDGGVKILDFGIAKSDGQKTETQIGTLKGKIPYMSPEQCASEPLDRRSDIYSLGVVLYELATGHRVHALGASEYEMMRAIVEGTITPPSKLDPTFPKALEAILERCLAKDRARRYATARALQADLEAFAREGRLAISSLALSSYMTELFGKRAEAWRDALARGEAELDEERAAASVEAPRVEPRAAIASRPPLLEARARASVDQPKPAPTEATSAVDAGPEVGVSRRKLGAVEVIALAGRVNERFPGAAVGAALRGRVVLDLAGIHRVTSFGVREWLAMLSAAEASAPDLFLWRCSEPIVSQLGMVKGFAGRAQIISFHAPYRCDPCGEAFTVALDCERDASAIRDADPERAPCPKCGSACSLDDDARSYLAFAAPHAGVAVPAEVRAAIDDAARAVPAEPLGKSVDGDVTRLAVRVPIDAAVRWRRALDGVEGRLLLDLAVAPSITAGGAAACAHALRALGPEVTSIRVEACPGLLAARLSVEPDPRVAIDSMLLDGRCAACRATRSARLGMDAVRAAASDRRELAAPCPRCGAPLALDDAAPLLALVAGPPASDPPAASTRASAPTSTATQAVSSTRPAPRSLRPLAVAGAIAAAALLGLLLIRQPQPQPPPSRSTTVASAPSAIAPRASDDPPAWAATPITTEGDTLFVVGRGRGASEDAAQAAARDEALDHLAVHLLGELAADPIASFVRARLPRGEAAARAREAQHAVAARYLAVVGASASPERADAHVARQGAVVSVSARYRIGKHARDAALATFRRTAAVAGMTLAPVYPLLERSFHASGSLVVIAVDPRGAAALAGVREGDVILAFDGQAVPSLGALPAAAPRRVSLEEGGAARVVELGR